MLRPCNFCALSKKTGIDVYSQPVFSSPVMERCSIIKSKLNEQHTTVRADSSASRGFAQEFLTANMILLTPKTLAEYSDKIVVANIQILVVSLNPMFDVWGKLDHYELVGAPWV